MENFKFYKTPEGRWYVDLPDYPGPQKDLEMVMGADTMLDLFAQGNDRAELILSETPFTGCSELIFQRETIELSEGATYKMIHHLLPTLNFDIWLCDVTKFVFGKFPKIIYYCNLSI